MAFTGTKAAIERAGIVPRHDRAFTGQGGGDTRIVPFTVDGLALGEVAGRDLQGVCFPEGDFLADVSGQFDFPIGGVVSRQFFRPYALTFDYAGMRMFLSARC